MSLEYVCERLLWYMIINIQWMRFLTIKKQHENVYCILFLLYQSSVCECQNYGAVKARVMTPRNVELDSASGNICEYLMKEIARNLNGVQIFNDKLPYIMLKDSWRKCYDHMSTITQTAMYSERSDPRFVILTRFVKIAAYSLAIAVECCGFTINGLTNDQ